MSLLNKYLKYKKKYLDLKHILDGGAQVYQPDEVSSVLPENVSIADVPGYGIVPSTKQKERILGNPNSKTEDSFAVATKEINGDTIIFMCVADGHGGTHVYSEMACKSAVKFFNEHMTWENIETQLVDLFIVLDSVTTAYMESERSRVGLRSPPAGGTTFVCTVINKTRNEMAYANLGDSKCILVRNGAIEHQSIDHDVSNPDELTRIRSRHPDIRIEGYYIIGNYGRKLMMTRSLGDWIFGNAVSKVPDIVKVNLSDGDVVVVTTDGLFEKLVVNSSGTYAYGPGRPIVEIAADVTSGLHTGNIAKHLIDEHLRKLAEATHAIPPYNAYPIEAAYPVARDGTDNKAVAVYIHNP